MITSKTHIVSFICKLDKKIRPKENVPAYQTIFWILCVVTQSFALQTEVNARGKQKIFFSCLMILHMVLKSTVGKMHKIE